MLNQDYDYVFKTVLVGSTGVGKSCLLLRYSDGIFNENFYATIGVDFKIRTSELNGNVIKLQIWDTAGQQKFKNITSSYYKGAHGIILVYDITDRSSFIELEGWINQIHKHSKDNAVCLLVGNKCDLESVRTVSRQQANSFALSQGMTYIETSAKQTVNIQQTFEKLSEKMKETFGNNFRGKKIDAAGNNIKTNLTKVDNNKSKTYYCC